MNETKIFKILSYIGPLFLISLFIEQKNDYGIKLHCGQGMLLFVLELALGVVVGIASVILFFIPIVGWLAAALLSLCSGAATLAFTIIGIVNAATDKDVPLPIIGSFAFYK